MRTALDNWSDVV